MSSLSNLPDITFARKDAATIETEIIDQYQETSGTTLAAADPRKKLLQSQVPIVAGQRSAIDKAAKRNLLAYADSDFLDHIGVMVGCTRIAATTADTTLRFTLSKARTISTLIAKGTRVTAGDNVFFATTADLLIPAGTMTGDVGADCLKIGEAGNGYEINSLITLVDPTAYVSAVTNITASEGGADAEDDDNFRERIHLAPESFSCAGPDGAYEYWAKTASSLIIDAKPYSPTPGCVDICVLLKGGELPGTEILNAVKEICSDKKIRPMTDKVSAIAPVPVTYDIDTTFYIAKSNENLVESISKAVEAAVDDYITWQKARLARAVDPSELIYRMKKAGASRVTVANPVYTVIAPIQIATAGAKRIQYGGIENE